MTMERAVGTVTDTDMGTGTHMAEEEGEGSAGLRLEGVGLMLGASTLRSSPSFSRACRVEGDFDGDRLTIAISIITVSAEK